jgi:folate-binding protein YgfZ
MFVLRAKAKLADATGEYALQGLAGRGANGRPAACRPGPSVREGDVPRVRALPGRRPAARPVRRAGGSRPARRRCPDAVAMGRGAQRHRHAHGAVVEAFVPQMLNYESVGGVNFKKGCYPGQEVVARSQFRGTLKRRAFLVHADVPNSPPARKCCRPPTPEQPCGMVAQAAPAPDRRLGRHRLAAAGGGRGRATCTLGSADGPVLPDDVGVIGVAMFRERLPQPLQPPITPYPRREGYSDSERRSESSALGDARAKAAPPDSAVAAESAAAGSLARPAAPSPSLGTAHGRRETSYVGKTTFERAQPSPDEVVRIRYDSRENLVAAGVIPVPPPPRWPRPAGPAGSAGPSPFPGSEPGYVPDPPPRY